MKEESHPSGNGWLVGLEDSSSENNISGETKLYKTERDRPLCFHWKAEVDFTRVLPDLWTMDRRQNDALNSVLTEAVLAAETGQWVSYSRANPFYTGLRRYHGTAYTYTTVLRSIERALAHELIEEDRAPKGRRGWQSRFRATPRLMEVLQDARTEFCRPELIYLKDENGDPIDYHDTDATRRMRRELETLNEYLREISFDINAPDARQTGRHIELDGAYYLPVALELHRVFNRGSWSKGGWVYGWWQGLKKSRRAAALINGEPVLEPDFDAMHAAMLYARRGRELGFDPYDTGDYDRSEGKLAFVIGINARSHVGAINSLAKKLDGDKSHAAAVYAAVRRRNKDLDDAGAFGSDKGAGLMRQDSEITIGALKGCAKAGIPALPVHDSMLTPARHAEAVAELMRDSFARQFNGSIRCRVRVSANPVLHMPFPLSSLFLSPLPSPAFVSLAPSENRQPARLSLVMLDNDIQGDLLPFMDSPGLAVVRRELPASVHGYTGGILSLEIRRAIQDQKRALVMTQEEVAAQIGLSRPQLANALQGRCGLSPMAASRLVQWLKAPSRPVRSRRMAA